MSFARPVPTDVVALDDSVATALWERSATSLELKLARLPPLLADPQVTEICINRPGEAMVQTYAGWQRHELPGADVEWCRDLAKLVGNETRQRIDETHPLLSASLPGGQRVQFVLPPATLQGHVSITIRCPSRSVRTLDELAAGGLFTRCRDATGELDEGERELLELKQARQYEAFLRHAIRLRKNIVVSGSTGTGKTTATNAMILEIPRDERLIIIEDAKELVLDGHPNVVRLFYSKDGQGLAQVTPKSLLEATLRMRPDRVFLSELRSDEAFEYLRVIAAHPGSITSVHGASAQLALVQIMLLVKQSEAGQSLTTEDVWKLLYSLIDIVVQFGFDGRDRFVKELWYDPQARRRVAA